MRKFLLLAAALVTLTACSVEGLIDSAFPDRERLAFRTSDGATVVQYACEPKGNEAATRANASRAHNYFDREFSQLVDSIVEDMLKSGGPSTQALNARIDAEAEEIVQTTEDRFQCLAYDFRDA